jgi:L-2,4-diaminobutyrate decarboxylase
MIRESKKLELAVDPDANIVCFRFAPKGIANSELNRINTAIRDTIIKEGSFYIVQTELEGKLWIRTTIINPVTDEEDLMELIQRVIELGAKS